MRQSLRSPSLNEIPSDRPDLIINTSTSTEATGAYTQSSDAYEFIPELEDTQYATHKKLVNALDEYWQFQGKVTSERIMELRSEIPALTFDLASQLLNEDSREHIGLGARDIATEGIHYPPEINEVLLLGQGRDISRKLITTGQLTMLDAALQLAIDEIPPTVVNDRPQEPIEVKYMRAAFEIAKEKNASFNGTYLNFLYELSEHEQDPTGALEASHAKSALVYIAINSVLPYEIDGYNLSQAKLDEQFEVLVRPLPTDFLRKDEPITLQTTLPRVYFPQQPNERK